MPNSWDRFAAREPYFAVLTHDRYLRANWNAAAEAEFFESGEAYVSELYGIVRARVAPHFAPVSVLEYGCGAGRLLEPFARRATTVTGVDISPAMLETARKHVPNAELIEARAFENDPRTFDLVNCFLVLQRMRRREGIELLKRLVLRVREGGAGVFHFPYRAHTSPAIALARQARARVPGLNALANLARRKPASTPFIESNTYDIDEVIAVLQDAGFASPHVIFTRHGDLDSVIVYALRRAQLDRRADVSSAPPARADETSALHIDVKKLIAGTPIEELNRTAEAYFSSLTDWEDHLAKPFSRADDAPQLLINLGVTLQGLSLTPGMTVLEFGAGTGWLSRFLTQLGCRAILMDVSPTALQIARTLYEKQPPIGDRPAPRFLVFDGRRIDLPDASVDRIVAFDAFHHAPNPEDVLREFGRVLKPAGIAAFAEPGPEHSKTAQSQYEMRTYGVVENDIDIHAIWEAAQRAGFADLKLAAYNVPPFHLSLAEYDDLLAAGDAYARWAESTRAFLHNVRDFFLTKAGVAEIDSRHAAGLRATIEASLAGNRVTATIHNTGRARWLPSDELYGGVVLGGHLYTPEGRLAKFDYAWIPIPRALAPQEEVTFTFDLPPVEHGRYVLELDCVANKVTWFAQVGSVPARMEVDVE
ncbi:MAG TPA: methyltransferase domain-containing protein [Thermoanaerobaculia bacterium]|nr:methyltransferase domain-containing protein [Thermoanaerobaculia bacterium]